MKPKHFLILFLLSLMVLPACATMAEQSVTDVATASEAVVATADEEETQPNQGATGETNNEESGQGSGSQPEEQAPHGYGPTPIMPVLTDAHQGFVYGPDQLIVVFAEGFQPNESLSVSVVHESDGIIKSDLGQTNPLGQMIIYHYVQETPDDQGAYPNGELSFQVSGDQGTEKSYAFLIDHNLDVQPSPISGCGVYPPPPLQLGHLFVAWCGGLAAEEPYAPFSISMEGEELFSRHDAGVFADGIGLIWLQSESGDPAGTWELAFDQTSFQIQVVSP
jgi:hypothetical protein